MTTDSIGFSAQGGLSRPGGQRPLFSIGIEGTFEPVSQQDTLRVTGHFDGAQWREDLALVRKLGLEEVRYPIPWHQVERRQGEYDWANLDAILAYSIGDQRLRIIADPLHHTSYPSWLEGGFLDPRFVERYVSFVRAFARRYPAVTFFTPFNEPTCTLDFCGYRGLWHPHKNGDASYVAMLRNTARAYGEIVQLLREIHPGAYILHVDTFEHHASLDRASEARAAFLNERRFLFDELVMGYVTRDHPLYSYLRENGFSLRDLEWHVDHPARINERGGNYYPLNEEQLLEGRTHHAPSHDARGLADVATDYAHRLPCPLSMTETNIQGTVADRISWLKYIMSQVEILGELGIPMRRFAWYPLFDCAGWNSLLQDPTWKRDPQGIFTCGPSWEREWTEFASAYAHLNGGATSADLPAYRFSSRHDHTLRSLKKQMIWAWQEAPEDGAYQRQESLSWREGIATSR